MGIPRHQFTTPTHSRRYCSKSYLQAAYKARVKENRKSDAVKMSVYRMIYDGRLKATRLSSKVTRISREDIEATMIAQRLFSPAEFYTFDDILKITGRSRSWTFNFLRRNEISHTCYSGIRHYAKAHFDKIWEHTSVTLPEKGWITIEQVCKEFHKSIRLPGEHLDGELDCAYGLSMGGKILSRILERDEIKIAHAVLDGAPLLPLPGWLIGPLRYFECINVWTCYHWTGFWKFVLHSHYYDVILDECRKVWPFGKGRAVLDSYKDIYTHKLESVADTDIHFWHGSKESFVAKPQVRHLRELHPDVHVEVFEGMNKCNAA